MVKEYPHPVAGMQPEEFNALRAEGDFHNDMFRPKGSEEELMYTRAKIVLASINIPLSDTNVRLALDFLKGRTAAELEEIYGKIDNTKRRNAFKRDLAKHINKGSAKLPSGRWCARIYGKYIGTFNTEFDAASAYDVEAVKRFGEFARTNIKL